VSTVQKSVHVTLPSPIRELLNSFRWRLKPNLKSADIEIFCKNLTSCLVRLHSVTYFSLVDVFICSVEYILITFSLFYALLSLHSWINLSFLKLLPFKCFYNSSDYIDEMIIVTLTPIIGTFLLFVSYRVRCSLMTHFGADNMLSLCYRWYKGEQQSTHTLTSQSSEGELLRRSLRTLGSRYFSLFLILSFVVLPGVSTVLADLMLCQNVDPDNVLEGSNTYLM